MTTNNLSLTSNGQIQMGAHMTDIKDLRLEVDFLGRHYVTGGAENNRKEIGTINDLVKLLISSKAPMKSREELYDRIKTLEYGSIGVYMNPLENKHNITFVCHKIRQFFGNIGFDRAENLKSFETEKKLNDMLTRAKKNAGTEVTGDNFNKGLTEAKDLRQGIINPFQIDYKKGSKAKTADEQFQQIRSYVQNFLDDPNNNGKTLAITYAANTPQANAIYAGYKNGKAPTIRGSNQAEVFGLLAEEINKRGWASKVHILPVPTCDFTPLNQRTAVSMEDVEKSMSNIEKHLNDKNCYVLGYQNENSRFDTPLAIGGGVASKVWDNTPQQTIAHYLFRAWMRPKPGS